MNTVMYYIFIIAGIVLLIVGINGVVAGSRAATNDTEEIVYAEPEPEPAPKPDVKGAPELEPSANCSDAPEVARQPASAKAAEPKPAEKSMEPQEAVPSNKQKGNLFEGFVADCFADRDIFTVLEWNQGTTSPGGVYAENNTDPDFHIRHKIRDDYSIDYYIEAKYHSKWGSDGTVQLNDYQIKRYRKFQKDAHRKVLLILGMAGTPGHPAETYLVPLDSIKEFYPSREFLKAYLLPNPHQNFEPRTRKYFLEKVFAKKKRKSE